MGGRDYRQAGHAKAGALVRRLVATHGTGERTTTAAFAPRAVVHAGAGRPDLRRIRVHRHGAIRIAAVGYANARTAHLAAVAAHPPRRFGHGQSSLPVGATLAPSATLVVWRNRWRTRADDLSKPAALSQSRSGEPWHTHLSHPTPAGIVWDELLMPLGGPAQALTVAQNRATIGVGIPVSRTQRVELAHLNLYNALATRRANEINHTLWLSWHYTGLAPRQR